MKRKKGLDKGQIKFITKKVKELGCMEAVRRLYKEDCLVDKFAVKTATALSLPERPVSNSEYRRTK